MRITALFTSGPNPRSLRIAVGGRATVSSLCIMGPAVFTPRPWRRRVPAGRNLCAVRREKPFRGPGVPGAIPSGCSGTRLVAVGLLSNRAVPSNDHPEPVSTTSHPISLPPVFLPSPWLSQASDLSAL